MKMKYFFLTLFCLFSTDLLFSQDLDQEQASSSPLMMEFYKQSPAVDLRKIRERNQPSEESDRSDEGSDSSLERRSTIVRIREFRNTMGPHDASVRDDDQGLLSEEDGYLAKSLSDSSEDWKSYDLLIERRMASTIKKTAEPFGVASMESEDFSVLQSKAEDLHRRASEQDALLMDLRNKTLGSSDEEALKLWPQVRLLAGEVEMAWDSAEKAYQTGLDAATAELRDWWQVQVKFAHNEKRKKVVASLWYKARQAECEDRIKGTLFSGKNFVKMAWDQAADGCQREADQAPAEFRDDWLLRRDKARENANSELKERKISNAESSSSRNSSVSSIEKSKSLLQNEKEIEIERIVFQAKLDLKNLRDSCNKVMSVAMAERQESVIKEAFEEQFLARAKLLYAWQKQGVNPLKHLSGNFVKKLNEALEAEKKGIATYAQIVRSHAQIDSRGEDMTLHQDWINRIAADELVVEKTRAMKKVATGFVDRMKARWSHSRMKAVLDADKTAVQAAWSQRIHAAGSQEGAIDDASSNEEDERGSMATVEGDWLTTPLKQSAAEPQAEELSVAKIGRSLSKNEQAAIDVQQKIQQMVAQEEMERSVSRDHHSAQMSADMIEKQKKAIADGFEQANLARAKYLQVAANSRFLGASTASYIEASYIEKVAQKKYAKQVAREAMDDSKQGDFTCYANWQQRIAADTFVVSETRSFRNYSKKHSSSFDIEKAEWNHARAKAILQADEAAFRAAWPEGPTGI